MKRIALVLVVVALVSGCSGLGRVPKAVFEERIVEDSTGKYRIIVCPHCGKQIKIPF